MNKIYNYLAFIALKRSSKPFVYFFTLLLMGFALWVRLLIAPISAGLQYVTFFPAITLAAIAGGYRAGLLATAIGLVFATYIFTPPYYSISAAVLHNSLWSNLVFLADGIILSVSIEAMHRYRQIAQHELMLANGFKTIFNLAGAGIARVGRDGQWLEVNQRLCEIAGYSAEELTRLKFQDITHPDDLATDLDYLNRLLAGDIKFFTSEKRYIRKSGEQVWVNLTVAIDPNPDGSVNNFITVVEDINQRKHAESITHIAAVTFDSHDAIMITDSNKNIIRVNKAFERVTGFSTDDVLGKNPRILKSGRHDESFYAAMHRKVEKDGYWEGDIWDRRKNGEIYPKWMTITAIMNAQGVLTDYVAIFRDISERKQAENEIYNLAFYDALTKLPNRRLLLDRLDKAVASSSRTDNFGALIFIDLDNFKTLNDTRGHDVGDQLLQRVANQIISCVRECDTVSRFGGDEFVVMLTDLSQDVDEAALETKQISKKILDRLNQDYLILGIEHQHGASIGITLFNGESLAGDELLKQADIAMYQAKAAGRNTLRFFDPAMQANIALQVELDRELHKAIVLEQLYLYYQIQYTNDCQVLGAEALIRWIHPERGLISPTEFIPIAESSSLIIEIGQWVLETACQQLKKWAKNDRTRNLILAINVSAHQFEANDFVDRVKNAIGSYRIDPSRLKLELTESVIVKDIDAVVSRMHALKALGVRLSLDDFGTGYSSLSCLKRLPLDQIKIDQSFMRDILTDSSDAVMVKTIIELANNFQLNVIAEGVETKGQLEFLEKNGCLAYQGYLFSKPLPLDQFEALLETPI